MTESLIASRSLSSGAHSRDPLPAIAAMARTYGDDARA